MAALLPILMLLTLGLMGVVAWAVASSINRLRFSVPGARGAEAKTLAAYVHTFSRTLSTLGVSRSARKLHVDELKANLAEAVANDGADAALAGLGPAGALATGYADYRPRPTWVVGIGAAIGTWLVTAVVHLRLAEAYGSGVSDGMIVEAFSGNTVRSDSLGLVLEASIVDAAHVSASATSPWLVLLPIVAFLVASKAWRSVLVRQGASVKV